MIGVRVKSSGSWLDPECCGVVGWRFGKRLWDRCSNELGVFLTLTYRHNEYSSAKELWWRQQERQDVALFMRRLGRALNQSLKGRWVCKLEFQAGGWVHWHIILLGIERIDHTLLTRAWGLGFVWVKRMTKNRVLYLAKYVAKNGKLPAWLYGERPRSIKVVRVSPGFWKEPSRQYLVNIDSRPQRLDGYVSIGERLKRKGIVISLGNRRRFSRLCDPGRFLVLLALRATVTGMKDGWLVFDASLDDVDEVWRQAVEWEKSYKKWLAAQRSASTAAVPQPRSGAGREAALHLRGTCNPDVWPDWLRVEFEEDAIAFAA